MPKEPHIDDRTFFGILDDYERKRHEIMLVSSLPWKGVSEDRERVHDVLDRMYASIGLAPAKKCWAKSPYSMFGAMSFLRQMQITSRQEAIKSIVPATENPLDVEAKRTFLEAVMERDLTVSMGGNLREQLFGGKANSAPPLSVTQLASLLAGRFTPPSYGKPLPAGWRDWVVYPLMAPFSYDLQSQTLCLAVFAKCAWLCRPPVVLDVDEDGNLTYARFEDGFEVTRKTESANSRLTDGKTLELPEETA